MIQSRVDRSKVSAPNYWALCIHHDTIDNEISHLRPSFGGKGESHLVKHTTAETQRRVSSSILMCAKPELNEAASDCVITCRDELLNSI